MLRYTVVISLMYFAIPLSAMAQVSRYDACMNLVKEQPAAAYEEALTWQSENGGAAAKHCIASALLSLGDLERGAERLENLGFAPDIEDDGLRAQIFAQATEAFLQLGDGERALRVVDAGLALQPNNTELQLGRARALAAQGKTKLALDELNILLGTKPNNVLGLMLRASSLIELQRIEEAGRDVGRAVLLAPTDVDVLLLRGQWREAQRLAQQH